MSTYDDGSTPLGLTDDEKATIDAIHDRRLTATHYELLGVPRDADRKTLRDAYFGLSKRFHPDVFFKRDLGEYKQKVDDLFRAFTRSYEVLSNPRQRAGYDLHLGTMRPSSVPPPAPPERVSSPGPDVTPPARETLPVLPPRAPTPVHSTPTVASVAPPPAISASSLPPPVVSMLPPAVTSGSVPPRGSSPSLPPSQTVPPGSREPLVVPPRLRPQTGSQSAPPSAPPQGSWSTAVIDPAARQRAMEAMARKLGNPGPRPRSVTDASPAAGAAPSSGRPAASDVAAMLEERRAKAFQLLATGEEAQKKGDLNAALEAFKAASDLNKGDESIRARIDAVSQLANAQKVGDLIEQAREAMRAGRADNAARFWEQAWQGRQSDPALLLNAAEVLAKHTKDHKRAAELAQRALMIDPKLIKGYLTLAGVFIDAGLRASARGAIDNAAKLEPLNPAIKELRDKLGPPTIAEQLGLRGR